MIAQLDCQSKGRVWKFRGKAAIEDRPDCGDGMAAPNLAGTARVKGKGETSLEMGRALAGTDRRARNALPQRKAPFQWYRCLGILSFTGRVFRGPSSSASIYGHSAGLRK
jgi:hypothetical protein